jgi:hypothetical protein
MLFTQEQIESLVDIVFGGRDAFEVVGETRSRVVVYLFDREDKFEVRIIRHYLDHFNMMVEELMLDHFFIEENENVKVRRAILEALNELALLKGGTTR